jgi:hypothetical protein
VKEANNVNTDRQTTVVKVKITAPILIRWAGLAAMVAGVCFVVLGLLHPPNVLSSGTTTRWTIVHSLALAMSLFGLLGIMGLYARQVKEAGWLWLVGFLLLIVCWWIQTAFVFAEAFIAPPLAKTAPGFVDGLLGVSYGHTGGIDLGALPAIASLAGRSARHCRLVDPRGRAAPARHPAASGDPGGDSSGLAGLCALV